MTPVNQPDFGALTISLDFELHWGVRDHFTVDGNYRANLLGEYQAIPAMLKLFNEYDVAATWAVTGFLFAHSKTEWEAYKPEILPKYHNRKLFPYDESIGNSEQDDPFHYAPSLIELIRKTPRQEIGTHTFSHYYCLENGQDEQTFAADLQSAISIAKNYGIELSSIIFPRNQHNSAYDEILLSHGITCFRGNQPYWMYELADDGSRTLKQRAARLLDTHFAVTGTQTIKWNEIWERGNIANVRASYFLRPTKQKVSPLDKIRLRRITKSLEYAAKNNEIVHLWWHPHNFGINLETNINFLREVLDVFAKLRQKYGMKSLSMQEVAETAKQTKQYSSKNISQVSVVNDLEKSVSAKTESATANEQIVLLCTDGDSTRAVYHALKAKFENVVAVVERPVSKKLMLKRRIKRLGIVPVVGQSIFMAAVIPFLKQLSKKRLEEIKGEYQLNQSPLDSSAYLVDSVNSEDARNLLRELNPKVVVVNGTRIIGSETLNSVSAPFINMHAGVTPLYRGVHGAYWALAEGKKELAGTTVHFVDEGIDTGNIIGQVVFEPKANDNFGTYPYIQTAVGIPVLLKAVGESLNGGVKRKNVIEGLSSKLRYHPTIWEYLMNYWRNGAK